jgi:PAS domain S-box-containing protein
MSEASERRSLFFELRALLGLVVVVVLAIHPSLVPPSLWLLGIGFVGSDLLIRFLPLSYFRHPAAGYAVFFVDVGVLTIVLHSLGGRDSELILFFYLTVFIATIGEDVRKSIGTAVVIGALYFGLRLRESGGILWDPATLVPIPLFFVTALTCGYLAQELRDQKKRVRSLKEIQNALRVEVDRFSDNLARSEDLRAIAFALMQRFRNLVQDLDAIVWEADAPSLQFTFVSERTEDILGYTVDQWFKEPDFWPSHIHPEDRARVVTARRQATYGGHEGVVEYRMVGADGRIVWLSDVMHLFRDPEGRAQYLRGVMIDITSRKQLEEQFRQSQKMEAVGRLAGGVAHDFNNLLTIILGYCQLALDQLRPDDTLRRPVGEIQKAGERAAALTRRLLAFSRRQALDPQVLDLNSVVVNTEKMLRRLIGEDIDLIISEGPALGSVKADPTQIEQVLMNLAVNARDAMPRGGKLIIGTADVELDQAYARNHIAVRPGPYVMLAVSDTGTGMDPVTVSHIFEPFFTTKEQGKGTGLGLATVFGIVKQSGGNIWVYSEPGHGTTFKIYLPRVEEVAVASQLAVPTAPPPRGTETILLVEDDDGVRSLVRGVLQTAGYKVLEASRPVEALVTCQTYTGPIHLLFTDVVMPQMSGRDLAERLKLLSPETKVLYMSGFTGEAIVHHGVLERGVSFIQKPSTPDLLVRKVREVLDGPQVEDRVELPAN